MPKKRVLGLDFDNVLMDFYSGINEYHNQKYNTDYSREKCVVVNLEKVWGCTTEEMHRRIVDFYHSDIHSETPPMAGAREALEKLRDSHSLVVVTSRPNFIKEKTMSWLDKHFPNLFDQVYFTNLYLGEAKHKKSKAEACKELGVDVFVDDFVSYATDVAQSGTKTLLLDAPWNRDVELHPNITRVNSWDHILEVLS